MPDEVLNGDGGELAAPAPGAGGLAHPAAIPDEHNTNESGATLGKGAWSRNPLDNLEILDGKAAGGFGGTLRPVRTSEQGKALVQRRIAKAEAAARAELARSAEDNTVIGGWRGVVRTQIVQAKAGKAGSTAAAAFVGRVTGLVRPREARQADGGGAGVAIHVGEGAAVALGSLLGRLLGK